MKKIILLIAAVLMMVACGNKVSYKGFTCAVPDNYYVKKSSLDGGMQYLLFNKDNSDNYVYIEITDDFLDGIGGEPDNAQISRALAEEMYSVVDTFIFSDEDAEVDEDEGVNFAWNDDPDEAIYAEGQIVGTYEGKPFYAYANADLWGGPNAVVTLLFAFDKEELKYQIDNIFKTYEWKK